MDNQDNTVSQKENELHNNSLEKSNGNSRILPNYMKTGLYVLWE